MLLSHIQAINEYLRIVYKLGISLVKVVKMINFETFSQPRQ